MSRGAAAEADSDCRNDELRLKRGVSRQPRFRHAVSLLLVAIFQRNHGEVALSFSWLPGVGPNTRGPVPTLERPRLFSPSSPSPLTPRALYGRRRTIGRQRRDPLKMTVTEASTPVMNTTDTSTWSISMVDADASVVSCIEEEEDRFVSGQGTIEGAEPGHSSQSPAVVPPFPLVVWRFARPHTMIGSALAIPALHMLAVPLTRTTAWPLLVSSVFCIIPSLLMNLYITGLNQITDVEIDKINKPHLPLAAGILSPRAGTVVVVAALVSSLLWGRSSAVLGTPGLNLTLWGSALLGTLYSLPPVRFKRFPVMAALCIVAVRGTIINAGFYAHAQAVPALIQAASTTAPVASQFSLVSYLLQHDPRCYYSSLYFGVFGIVIALMKDVPDVIGDRVSDIYTLSVRIGPSRIFYSMIRLLQGLLLATASGLVYSIVTAATTTWSTVLGRSVGSLTAVAGALVLQRQSRRVDPHDRQQVYDYYMLMWKIFYFSYLLLPVVR
jgi:homogentisate phytyltransferase / homogentisate geranylgeranyltransferase